MTIKEVLNIVKKHYLGKRAVLECEILLANILDKNRIFLHIYDDFKISKDILDSLLKQVDLLNKDYPIEYITKKVGFFSQDFFIDEGALIPRPESEILVTKVSNLIVEKDIRKIFEIGIGSGVISIILCLLHKDLEVIATDISKSAIDIALKNIDLKSKLDSTLKNRITIIQTNLLDGIERNSEDFIVSNPPYIKNSYKIPNNLKYEPEIALFGGECGDEILKQVINLKPKFLCCEIGFDQQNINKYLQDYKNVEFYKDYANYTRGFVASN